MSDATLKPNAAATDALPDQAPASRPIGEYVQDLVKRAHTASSRLATLSTAVKNQALLAMAEGLEQRQEAILAANEKDLESFGTESGRKAMADRLRLTPERIG